MRRMASITVLAVLGAVASAQEIIIPSGGYGLDSPYNRLYNSRRVTTFEGRVTGKIVSPPMNGMAEAVRLTIRTPNGGTARVDLGPAWYVDRQIAKVKIGDWVRVTGSKANVNGASLILASQVVRGKKVLAIRNQVGVPYWIAYRTTQPEVVNVEPMEGTISSLATFNINNEPYSGYVIDTANGPVNVALAPAWYYTRQDQVYTPGNNIRIYGGNVVSLSNGANVTVATSVYGPTGSLVFRDAWGNPVWLYGR